MINYGKIISTVQPAEIQITNDAVLVAKNIEKYEQELEENRIIRGYKYDYYSYTKDEYILLLAEKSAKIDELEEELAAAKIVLGVD